MRQFDNKELSKRVDEVLFYIWDPIGVQPEPCARSEYEGYVPKICQLVEENDTIGPISAHLASIVREAMEINPDKTHCDEVAELLLDHKRAIQEGLA
jgi:hypothetical protein